MRTRTRMAYTAGAAALATCLVAGTLAIAQEKKEETPFWAVGRPKNETADKMAPVAALPVPTPANQLPKLKVPSGFKVETYASGILDARGLRHGDKGTVFVSSLFVAGKIYAITNDKGKHEVKTILSGLQLPNGIEFHKGSLYVATPKEITRYDKIEDNLDHPPKPVMVYDKLPGDVPHGWKFIKFGPDGKLYVPVGAPCNICMPDENHAQIFRINADGSGKEVVARGVRNSVGFDFDPRTKDLWFTDNQRDWLSEDMPLDELNHVTKPGQQHFGYPFCHSGIMVDPQFGWGKSCDDYVKPAVTLGAHAAPLGMRFYTGKMFPSKYRNAIFIARHGPWNRTKKYADVAVAFVNAKGKVTSVEPFLTGFVKDNQYLGRPVDLLVMPDGSMLVSDDHAGAVYRISYGK
ncbi:MAG TPA: PQQ-dependent sugar dehydrogenase [Hyphomicrobiaceae bacterium]|jgi:glucose/arabinose dehydrogenase|nr:PQQ-dependent sugar dehydrogenase [Hyphomicrobiaceae bacterium]